MLAACLGVLGLAGCGKEAESGTKQEKVRLMVWSPSEDQSKESGEWLQTMCESFAEENPQWDITFVYGVADEATAATQVSQDPEASADVFMFANDTLTIMTDANALAKFGGTYREEIEASNTPEVLKSLTMNDELYGVPFTTNKAFTCENTTLEGEGRFPTGISYLKKLGVNYVQIMPMYDYGSVDESGEIPGFNWGYDPVNYNVPEGSYSTDPYHGEVRIKELKEMVQSLHKNGFRVIMDVVYNHTYSLESWFQKTAPWYFYRVWEDGSISNGSACGNDVASERTMCAKYILESVLYWTEEYHIDGFRFDLMGLLDVKLMNQIRRELDARYGKGEKLVFGEPWRAEKTAMEGEALPADKQHIGLLDEQIGMFSDDTRDAIKGSVFEADETLEVKAPSQIITYVSAHDNHTLWDKLSETTENKKQRQKEYRLAAGIYLTCQGTPFFLSGEEFARTKGGRDNTYNASIDINRLNWKQAEKEQELIEYYRGMIGLRKQLPGLCDKSAEAKERIQTLQKRPGCVGFLVDNRANDKEATKQQNGWEKLCIIYNANQKSENIHLPEGTWEILADGEDSYRWKMPVEIAREAVASPVSILILGQRK